MEYKSNQLEEETLLIPEKIIEPVPVILKVDKVVAKVFKKNRLIIPKIAVNALIVEGKNISALDRGMWRIPTSSTPDQGGNTVIAGHRFLYTSGPNTFFFLDKVRIKDKIVIYWKDKKYVYIVYKIKEYSPNSYEVGYNTKNPILTLYTCTPLWTAQRRLVIKASLQQ